jgi:hypothetical protein
VGAGEGESTLPLAVRAAQLGPIPGPALPGEGVPRRARNGVARDRALGRPKRSNPQPKNRQKSFSPCVSIPCSKSIVGVKIGLEGPGPNFRCWGCAKTGVGHYKGECPKFWGSKGRPLPGFNARGELEADQWIGDEPKRATFKNWVSFLEDSGNFPTGAEPANIDGAPDMEAFQDRAAHARK